MCIPLVDGCKESHEHNTTKRRHSNNMKYRDNKIIAVINDFFVCAIFTITTTNIDVNFQKRL